MNVGGSSLSFLGLRKRTKFTNPWLVNNYFPENHNLFVDSGCSTLNNSKEVKYNNDDLRAIGEHYYQWVSENIDGITLYSEFDAIQLGRGWLESYRESARDVLWDKLLPI